MKRGLAVILLFASLALLLAGCVASAEKEEATSLKIVATDFPCYDFARAVLGGEEGITLLIKPGAEVHTFEPAPGDVVAMTDADLFVYIGGESDRWADGMLASLGEEAPKTLRMFDCVEALAEETVEGMQSEEEEEEEDAYDEHIWTSPKNAALMVQAVSDALCGIDPARADLYRANAEAYIAQIEEVDAAIAQTVENAARRELIFGDRFPFLYFARQYDLTYYAAFPGCAAETEPSPKTLVFLIDKVVSDGAKAVYTIELSNGSIAKAIAEETGAKALTLHSIQNVTADEFAAGETYVSLMWKNRDALEEGLN